MTEAQLLAWLKSHDLDLHELGLADDGSIIQLVIDGKGDVMATVKVIERNAQGEVRWNRVSHEVLFTQRVLPFDPPS